MLQTHVYVEFYNLEQPEYNLGAGPCQQLKSLRSSYNGQCLKAQCTFLFRDFVIDHVWGFGNLMGGYKKTLAALTFFIYQRNVH